MRICPHCGLANVYRDEGGGYTCLSCARQFDRMMRPYQRPGRGVARAARPPYRHGYHTAQRRKVGA